jgi:hypothetical protein
MDKKTFVIGVLSLSAIILFAANMLQPRFAEASFVVRDNEYTCVTAQIRDGSDALYIIDNRGGKVVVLGWNPNKRLVEPYTPATDMTKAFTPAGGARPR